MENFYLIEDFGLINAAKKKQELALQLQQETE
jgi:hypothetical protein